MQVACEIPDRVSYFHMSSLVLRSRGLSMPRLISIKGERERTVNIRCVSSPSSSFSLYLCHLSVSCFHPRIPPPPTHTLPFSSSMSLFLYLPIPVLALSSALPFTLACGLLLHQHFLASLNHSMVKNLKNQVPSNGLHSRPPL